MLQDVTAELKAFRFSTATMQDSLDTEVRFVKGVGEVRAAQLARLDIFTVRDLLFTLPHRYEDRRQVTPVADVHAGEWATISGVIRSMAWQQPRFGRGYVEALLSDSTGTLCCRWFGARHVMTHVAAGDRLVVYGKPTRRRNLLVMEHPDYECAGDEADESLHMGRIVPVYPLTEQLAQRSMRRIQWQALEKYADDAVDVLPPETRQRQNWMRLPEALRAVHFPLHLNDVARARARLVFEEFLCMQLVLVARKVQAERFLTGRSLVAPGVWCEQFRASLPFRLTEGQEQAVREIRADMEKARPMHRLLQGDVGSGKTVVAACAILNALECGVQAAVMAPTEILAAQHERTLRRYLQPLGLRIGLLSSSLDERAKIAARAAVADGRTQLVIGTHALIQDRVVFKDLGLVVIDEQHKFGVEQRGLLYGKGITPDVLVMTATPIPRTLAMTLYGDLDVTTIRELPKGRQEIVTRVIGESQLEKAYAFIRAQVAKGRQAFLVYPLVSESEQLEIKAATEMFQQLKQTVFSDLAMGLLHGQMPAAEKDSVMERFRKGDLHLLVATSVVEVGVDVPNASVMLVENAERFGLAQLHQLRGRIGRGAHKSYCILQGVPRSREAWQRLKIMERTLDGFVIAEEDFMLRGMGNLLGREQSGALVLRAGDPLRDQALLESAREEAFRLIQSDPRLEKAEHANLRHRARALYKSASTFVKVG
jgi:ATP-dependent DNA helicase RecG